MIFLITITCPGIHGKKVWERFIKDSAKGLPAGVKKWQTFFSSDGEKNSKTYHLIFTEKGKVDEAYLAVSKLLIPYSLDIEGYNLKTEILTGVSDATKIVQAVL